MSHRARGRTGVVLLALTGAAFAQDAPPSGAAPPTDPTVPADAPAAEPAVSTPDASARPASIGISIGEIVVTAQKREESINDVPLAISAVDGATLKDLGVTDTRDLSKIVPGFTAADNGYNTPVYTLRGIGYADTTYTATQTVGVYVDEVPLPYAVMTKGVSLDLDRVEVLKGPQGHLYGRNTTGGVINYIARKPTDAFEYSVAGTYANYETTEVEGYVSGPLLENVSGRLAARGVNSRKGWQYSITRPDDTLGQVNRKSARAMLDWKPADDTLVRFIADGWIDRSDTQAPQSIGLFAQNPFVPNNPEFVDQLVAASPVLGPVLLPLVGQNVTLSPGTRNHPTIDADTDSVRIADWKPGGIGPEAYPVDGKHQRHDDYFWRTALTAKTGIGAGNLTGIVSYGEVTSDGTAIDNSGLTVTNTDQVIFAGIETTAVELRLDMPLSESLDWMLGANASRDKGYEDHFVYTTATSALFPNPLNDTNPVATAINTSGRTEAEGYSAFTKLDWRLTDQWLASVALRYTREKRDFIGCLYQTEESTGVGTGPLFAAVALVRYQAVNDVENGDCLGLDENGQSGPYNGELKEDNVSGRASITWFATDDVMAYLSYARGFKSGGFPVVNSSLQSQYFPTQQEKLLAWEIGSKTTVVPGLLHVNVAAFDYSYHDKQLLSYFKDAIFGVLPLAVNIPKSRVYGAELDFQVTPLRGLFLSFAGAYIHARVEEFIGTTADGQVDRDFAGDRFNFTPTWTYTVLADYTMAVTGTMEAGVGVDYAYQGKTNATIEGDPLYELRENGKLNARLRFGPSDSRWSVMAWGRNLTNEFSAAGVFRTADSVARTTGMPRTYGLTLTYNGF
ncbi:MAG TPA: TonB-dependent receptor [Nevskiaceae bacterium]|nr:TonB-dependent receptor [Nevskiaceae bacterium]